MAHTKEFIYIKKPKFTKERYNMMCKAVSNNGELIAASIKDDNPKFKGRAIDLDIRPDIADWDIKSNRVITEIRGEEAEKLLFAVEDRYLIALKDNRITFINTVNWKADIKLMFENKVKGIIFSPDNTKFIIYGRDYFYVYNLLTFSKEFGHKWNMEVFDEDAITFKKLFKQFVSEVMGDYSSNRVKNTRTTLIKVMFSKDGKYLGVQTTRVGLNDRVYIYNTDTWEREDKIQGFYIKSFAFKNNNNEILALVDKKAILKDLDKGKHTEINLIGRIPFEHAIELKYDSKDEHVMAITQQGTLRGDERIIEHSNGVYKNIYINTCKMEPLKIINGIKVEYAEFNKDDSLIYISSDKKINVINTNTLKQKEYTNYTLELGRNIEYNKKNNSISAIKNNTRAIVINI